MGGGSSKSKAAAEAKYIEQSGVSDGKSHGRRASESLSAKRNSIKDDKDKQSVEEMLGSLMEARRHVQRKKKRQMGIRGERFSIASPSPVSKSPKKEEEDGDGDGDGDGGAADYGEDEDLCVYLFGLLLILLRLLLLTYFNVKRTKKYYQLLP